MNRKREYARIRVKGSCSSSFVSPTFESFSFYLSSSHTQKRWICGFSPRVLSPLFFSIRASAHEQRERTPPPFPTPWYTSSTSFPPPPLTLVVSPRVPHSPESSNTICICLSRFLHVDIANVYCKRRLDLPDRWNPTIIMYLMDT